MAEPILLIVMKAASHQLMVVLLGNPVFIMVTIVVRPGQDEGK